MWIFGEGNSGGMITYLEIFVDFFPFIKAFFFTPELWKGKELQTIKDKHLAWFDRFESARLKLHGDPPQKKTQNFYGVFSPRLLLIFLYLILV